MDEKWIVVAFLVFCLFILCALFVPLYFENQKEIKMAEAGMEQVIGTVTNENGEVAARVLWKKTKE